MEEYDVVIIGGGAAGLTAAIYAARYHLKLVVLAKEFGGLAATAHKICNYPGFPEISGMELMQRMEEQARKLEVPIKYESVSGISPAGKGFMVTGEDGAFYSAKHLIYAAGSVRRKLDIKGEDKLLGRGVSYCATCDGAFFKDKVVSVVGGSDAALTSALLLAEYARKVEIVYRGNKFKAEPAWISLVEKSPKITAVFNEEIEEIEGATRVEAIRLKSGRDERVDGVFIEIGSDPATMLLEGLGVSLEKSKVKVDSSQMTSVCGLYAAGDITTGSDQLKQIVTAAAEGAVAAHSIYDRIQKGRACPERMAQ